MLFWSEPKTHFFGGPKWYFFKIKFQSIFAFVLHADFHKKILIFWPPGIFWKLKNFDARAVRSEILELDF